MHQFIPLFGQVIDNIMKTTTFSKYLMITSLFVLSFACLSTIAQEVENEREFSYEEGSEIGPGHWGEIHPEWRDCNSGEMQSPIDLLNERVQVVSHLGRLQRNYQASNATLINRGHDMMLRWTDDAGYITINGTQYNLRQCHWHSPSEHTISGRRFDMEAHLVHQSDDNRTAVIGILYKIGRPDSFLSMVEQNLEELTHIQDVERSVGTIDGRSVKFGSRKYYRYVGSLTVPPCTQNIIWTMVRKVRTVTREQVQLIREAVHDGARVNARPLQPINGRSVHMFRPKDRAN